MLGIFTTDHVAASFFLVAQNRDMTNELTASQLAWKGLGMPQHGYPEEDVEDFCTTCGIRIARGVHTRHISSATFSNHATFFRGGEYACGACAYLFEYWVKKRFANAVAWVDAEGNAQCISPLLSRQAALEQGRTSWWDALKSLEILPPHTPVVALLATDLNIRQWPHMRLCTRGDFGVLLHTPDYESTGYASGFAPCSLDRILELQTFLQPILEAGYSKSRILRNLLEDAKLFAKQPHTVLAWEKSLVEMRPNPEFLPALLSCGLLKGETDATEPEPQPTESRQPTPTRDAPNPQPPRDPKPTREKGDGTGKSQPGLF